MLLERAARPRARGYPTVRRGGLGEGAGRARGAQREATARRGGAW
jgi:hypothetical protein